MGQMDKAVSETDLRTYVWADAWEFVDVTFPTVANTDLVIRHKLGPAVPGSVHYQVVRQSTPGTVYEAPTGTVGARKWTSDYIVLRSDTASWNGRLVLTLARNEGEL